MKAALYLRVSTDVQETERQISELTAKANQENIQIVRSFQDKVSGFKGDKDRPELNELLKLTKDDIDVVYVHEISRLSRNPTYLKILIDQFADKGINIYFLVQNLSVLNKQGKREFTVDMMLSMLSEFAKYEIDLKNNRTKGGKREAIVNKGHSHSYKPPYGYTKQLKKLVIEPHESAIVTQIFNRYANGEPISQIVRWLNLNDIPTRNSTYIKKDSIRLSATKTLEKSEIKWTKGTVAAILKNTVYAGYFLMNDGYKLETHAIVSEDLFFRCQNQFKANINGADKTVKYDFLLRGFLKCGECGKYFISAQSHKVPFYKCADKSHKHRNTFLGCKNTSVKKDNIESKVWEAIKDTVIAQRGKQMILDNLNSFKAKVEEYTQEIDLIGRKQNALQPEQQRLVNLYVKGKIHETFLDEEQKRIQDELEIFEERKKNLYILREDANKRVNSINKMEKNSFKIEDIEKSVILKKQAITEFVNDIVVYKIDNLYSVFRINFTGGFTIDVLHQTYKNKCVLAAGTMIWYMPDSKMFKQRNYEITGNTITTHYIEKTHLQTFEELEKNNNMPLFYSEK